MLSNYLIAFSIAAFAGLFILIYFRKVDISIEFMGNVIKIISK